jgi:hypothetical protein
VDQASWFLNALPRAVTGFGSIVQWNDGRDVPDTIQAVFEYPGGVTSYYDATLANSFDGDYEMLFGSDSAVMMRGSKAWLFKEVDSPLLGWEVYARKDVFNKDLGIDEETGIALVMGASKLPPAGAKGPEKAPKDTALLKAMEIFLRNSIDYEVAAAAARESFGTDNPDAVAEQVVSTKKRSAAGFLEGYQSVVTTVKANEAILGRSRIEYKPEWFDLA